MDISLTIHIPIKARFNKKSCEMLIYIPFKQWLCGYGGWGKSKWFRIFGLTFAIGYWKLWPVEFRTTIQ